MPRRLSLEVLSRVMNTWRPALVKTYHKINIETSLGLVANFMSLENDCRQTTKKIWSGCNVPGIRPLNREIADYEKNYLTSRAEFFINSGAGHYRAGNGILDVQGMELRLIFHVSR